MINNIKLSEIAYVYIYIYTYEQSISLIGYLRIKLILSLILCINENITDISYNINLLLKLRPLDIFNSDITEIPKSIVKLTRKKSSCQ